MKRFVTRLARRAFALCGYEFRRSPEIHSSESFGISPLEDIRQLLRIEGNSGRLVIFDVGANVGTFVGYFRNALNGPMVYAFEPSPGAFGKLRANTIGTPIV